LIGSPRPAPIIPGSTGAATTAGGKACNPRILGIGADSGHHEQRGPSTDAYRRSSVVEARSTGPKAGVFSAD